VSLYPYIDMIPEAGGWGVYRYLSPFQRLPIGWLAGKKAEAMEELYRIRAEYAEQEAAERASRPVVCAVCRRETPPGLIEDDRCPECDVAAHRPEETTR